MRKLSMIFVLAIISFSAQAQNKDTISKGAFVNPEHPPEFPGGMEALTTYLSTNIHYPATARKNNVQGRVILFFIVEKDGTLTDIKVVRHVSTEIDAEALRVVSAMPKWTPTTQYNKLVRVSYVLPINFALPPKKQ